MATHSSVPAWSILWTEDPGRLESIGSQVGHNLVTEPPPPASFSLIYWKCNSLVLPALPHFEKPRISYKPQIWVDSCLWCFPSFPFSFWFWFLKDPFARKRDQPWESSIKEPPLVTVIDHFASVQSVGVTVIHHCAACKCRCEKGNTEMKSSKLLLSDSILKNKPQKLAIFNHWFIAPTHFPKPSKPQASSVHYCRDSSGQWLGWPQENHRGNFRMKQEGRLDYSL